ncbi:type II toxin-antitoxin system RelE/ParE family toxin [archaeon]|jgi:mRNA interferase RelE/StbE|nr:type II toxin-antitoxin system RelE/ParE family toxin [archaeon]MBT4351415.1 type II toxin-antitoxin system RelE/ParE family toxin [archaeon]MBT4647294.1 type II toxin-antitoxin system RelE/ParE family toxin [archaeon]MBT6821143.1 type II toxin-antitoxin system RelE/ParE family toxin [archaeon]MBT7391689.1 type II toxin-antitoxin system RelE/ParE family toxin [archaeon]
MSYKIVFSNFADKQLSKLPLDIQNRIISTIKRCRIRPYSHIKKLVSSKYFKLRIGNYRAILDIIDNKLIIHVIEIGHRKNIYKK